MLLNSDNVAQSVVSLRAHKLRTVLTVVGLTMGVATLITVMTIVQGANLYVEQKIANLGTNVFQVARTPFAATDFNVVIKALKNKHIELEDLQAVQEQCEPAKGRRHGQHDRQGSVRRQRTGRREHLRPHAEHGRHRYAHGRARALLHRRGESAVGAGLPDRRQPVAELLSPARSARQDQSESSDEEFTVDRDLREDRQRARAGPGQLRDGPAEPVLSLAATDSA